MGWKDIMNERQRVFVSTSLIYIGILLLWLFLELYTEHNFFMSTIMFTGALYLIFYLEVIIFAPLSKKINIVYARLLARKYFNDWKQADRIF